MHVRCKAARSLTMSSYVAKHALLDCRSTPVATRGGVKEAVQVEFGMYIAAERWLNGASNATTNFRYSEQECCQPWHVLSQGRSSLLLDRH